MTDPTTWAMIIVTFALGGVLKGVTGVGLPLIALPLLSARVGVPAAIAIIGLPSIITNAWQAWSLRRQLVDLPYLWKFLLAGMVGIAAGTSLLLQVPEALLSIGLGAMLLAYIAVRLARPDFALSARAASLISPVVGLAGGMLQGLTGIVAPIGVTFFNSLRLSRLSYLFATATMFLLFAIVQLSSIGVSGVLAPHHLAQGLVASLVALAFMPLGAWIGSKLSPTAFDRMILALLFVLALSLVAKALSF